MLGASLVSRTYRVARVQNGAEGESVGQHEKVEGQKERYSGAGPIFQRSVEENAAASARPGLIAQVPQAENEQAVSVFHRSSFMNFSTLLLALLRLLFKRGELYLD